MRVDGAIGFAAAFIREDTWRGLLIGLLRRCHHAFPSVAGPGKVPRRWQARSVRQQHGQSLPCLPPSVSQKSSWSAPAPGSPFLLGLVFIPMIRAVQIIELHPPTNYSWLYTGLAVAGGKPRARQSRGPIRPSRRAASRRPRRIDTKLDAAFAGILCPGSHPAQLGGAAAVLLTPAG